MKESKYDRVQRFLNREMNPDEVKDFDNDLANDADLMEGLASELAIRKAVDENRKDDIRQKLKAQRKNSQRSIAPSIIRIAAVFIFLAGAIWLFQIMTSTPDFLWEEDKIALENIVKESEPDLNIAGSDDGRIALKEKKYLDAITAFEVFLNEKKNQGGEPCDYKEINFYLGAIHLFRTNEYEKAIEYLECTEAEKFNGKNYNNDIPYYLILANLRAGQTEEAKSLMEKYKIQPSDLDENDATFRIMDQYFQYK